MEDNWKVIIIGLLILVSGLIFISRRHNKVNKAIKKKAILQSEFERLFVWIEKSFPLKNKCQTKVEVNLNGYTVNGEHRHNDLILDVFKGEEQIGRIYPEVAWVTKGMKIDWGVYTWGIDCENIYQQEAKEICRAHLAISLNKLVPGLIDTWMENGSEVCFLEISIQDLSPVMTLPEKQG